MKKLILVLALLFPTTALAQPYLTTKAAEELKKAFTDGGAFGVPRYATTALPTCGSPNIGALAFDTTAGSLVSCDGSSWASAGGGTPGGSDTQVQYNDGGAFGADSNLTWNKTSKTLSVAYPGPATFGSDLVTNGTFTGSATGWTLGGGGGDPDWAYATNNVTHGNGGGTATLTPTTPISITAGKKYRVVLTISGYSAGTVTIGLGGASTSALAFNATLWAAVVLTTTTANLTLTPTTTFVGTIDDVAVYEASTEVSPFLEATNGGTFPIELRGSASGKANAFFGDDTGSVITSSATANSGFGANALYALTNGTDNTGIGTSALRETTDGLRNTGIGRSALRFNRINSDNTAVGYLSGTALINGSQNTIVGSSTLDVATSVSNVNVFGYNIDPTVSNVGVFGNASVTDVAFGSAASATTGAAYIHAKGVEVSTTFANLGAVVVGAIKVCSDCTSGSNPCSGGGGGTVAVGIGAAWVCMTMP